MTQTELVKNIVDRIFETIPGHETDVAIAVIVETAQRVTAREVAGWSAIARQTPRIEQALTEVCVRCGVSRTELLRSRRTARISAARGIACVVLRHGLGMSYEDAGSKLGLDHSTVMHHCKKHRAGQVSYAMADQILEALRAQWDVVQVEAAE